MVSEGMVQVIWVFYLTVISTNSYYFLYFAICVNIVSAFLCILVPESPRYLYGINNLEACTAVLAQIAKANGVQNYQPAKFEVEYEIMVDNMDEIDGEEEVMEITTARKTENN